MIYFILILTLADGTVDSSRRFPNEQTCVEWASWLKGVHERQSLSQVASYQCQGVWERCKADPSDKLQFEMCNELIIRG